MIPKIVVVDFNGNEVVVEADSFEIEDGYLMLENEFEEVIAIFSPPVFAYARVVR